MSNVYNLYGCWPKSWWQFIVLYDDKNDLMVCWLYLLFVFLVCTFLGQNAQLPDYDLALNAINNNIYIHFSSTARSITCKKAITWNTPYCPLSQFTPQVIRAYLTDPLFIVLVLDLYGKLLSTLNQSYFQFRFFSVKIPV